MTVALTGFMACGKTTFGRAAAQILEREFIDLDALIEERYGSVRSIFEEGGEARFREVERKVLEEALDNCGDAIIALGGGTILSEANRALLRKKARVIWLDTSFDIIMSELDNADRPLVKEKSADEIRALYDTRRPIYESAADAAVVIDSTDWRAVVEDVAQACRRY